MGPWGCGQKAKDRRIAFADAREMPIHEERRNHFAAPWGRAPNIPWRALRTWREILPTMPWLGPRPGLT